MQTGTRQGAQEEQGYKAPKAGAPEVQGPVEAVGPSSPFDRRGIPGLPKDSGASAKRRRERDGNHGVEAVVEVGTDRAQRKPSELVVLLALSEERSAKRMNAA